MIFRMLRIFGVAFKTDRRAAAGCVLTANRCGLRTPFYPVDRHD